MHWSGQTCGSFATSQLFTNTHLYIGAIKCPAAIHASERMAVAGSKMIDKLGLKQGENGVSKHPYFR